MRGVVGGKLRLLTGPEYLVYGNAGCFGSLIAAAQAVRLRLFVFVKTCHRFPGSSRTINIHFSLTTGIVANKGVAKNVNGLLRWSFPYSKTQSFEEKAVAAINS